MHAHCLPSRSQQPPTPALRDLLVRHLGWQPADPEPDALEVDGRRYALLPLASCGPAVALLCEPRLGEPLPDYAARRRVRARLRRRFPRHLAIFTDPAHTVQVWSWLAREPHGPRAARELTRRPGASETEWLRWLRAIAREASGPDLGEPGSAATAAVASPVLRALLDRVARAAPGPLRRCERRLGLRRSLTARSSPPAAWVLRQRVQDAIEASEEPALLRAFWRGLAGFSLLDPACGRGGWLLAALAALEPVYAACLERMRSWVEEADGHRAGRGGTARFPDFRRTLERAGDLRLHPSWRHYVRERIVLGNLYGADRDPEAVAAAEVRLLLHVAAAGADGDAALPPATVGCNLSAGDLRSGFHSLAELRDALSGRVAAFRLRELEEEAEVLDRAERRLRWMRLEQGVPVEDLLPGRLAVLDRRTGLRTELDRLLARGGGGRAASAAAGPERYRRLHRCLEYCGILRSGGFALERGAR